MAEYNYDANSVMKNPFPRIKKLGAISANFEPTPFVWKGRLMRFENNPMNLKGGNEFKSHVVRDVEKDEIIARLCGEGAMWASAYVEDGKAYVFVVYKDKRDTIFVNESTDLVNWSERVLLKREGWKFFNTSLTKGPDGYVLITEAGEPKEYVGVPFTFFFHKSKDLVNWESLDPKLGFSTERYMGGPWIRYCDGWYYVISVTELPCQRYTHYIYRTKDFVDWYVGYYNPIITVDNDDRKISPNAHSDLTEEHIAKITGDGFIISASDMEMCDWNGKTYINYLVGNQLGFGYMCEAEYDGTVEQFLKSQFE